MTTSTISAIDGTLVAVYGTLRAGEGNHGLLDRPGASLVGRGTLDNVTMFGNDFPFPFVLDGIYGNACGTVVVEVYAVTPAVLDDLDHLEGYRPHDPARSMYLRVTRTVTMDDGAQASVQTYLKNGRGHLGDATIVVSGDWADAAGSRFSRQAARAALTQDDGFLGPRALIDVETA